MIRIKFFKTNNVFTGYKVSGHSDYAALGKDIICSAVSILSYTTLNAMQTAAGLSSEDIVFNIEEATGLMEVKLKVTNQKTEIVFKTFETGIKLLLEDYNQYIILDYKEV